MIRRRDVLKAAAGLAVGVEACRASNDALPSAIEDATGAEAVRALSIAGALGHYTTWRAALVIVFIPSNVTAQCSYLYSAAFGPRQ